MESSSNPTIIKSTPLHPLQPRNDRPSQHSIRAEKTISTETCGLYLVKVKSPLSTYCPQLLESPYWSVIIGISAIEQQYCNLRPTTSPYNCFGLMSNGHLIKFNDFGEAIDYLNDFLAKHEDKHPTVESLNCWYVQPCSPNWLKTVLKVKQELESL